MCLQVCPTGAIFNRMRMHYAVKGKAKEMQAIESACPRCGLLCPTIAQIRDNNLVRIDGVLGGDRPDRGQLCRKGRFEPLKTAGQRLLAPMVKGKDGSWTRTTWDDALERVAGRMGAIRSGKGAEALFGLVSGHCSNEEFLLFRDFMGRSFDGSYVDTLAGDQLHTIVQAWKELEKSFLGLREASWKRIPEADLVVFVGANPDERQPLVSALARRSAIEKGVSVGVVGPTDVHRPWTSLYVPAEEKELPLVIKALLAEVVSTIHATDPLTRWKKITDEVEKVKVPELLRKLRLSPEEREAFKRLARAFADAKAPILIAGDGVTGLKDPGALRGLMYLALLKGLLSNDTLRLVILKPNGNSAGALRLGIAADGSRDVTARWRAGLLLLDGEQAMDGKVMDRLSRVEFLAVISPYFPEALAAKAHVLIPKPLWTEQPGSYASLDGSEVGDAKGILSPPAGVRRSWETLMALAGRSGFRPDFESWEALRGKVMAEMKVDDQAR